MKKGHLCLLISLFLLAGSPAMSLADTVSCSFIGYIDGGPYTGEYGTGSFTYDDALLSTGMEFLSSADGISVLFNFGGQLFNQANDLDFDEFPKIQFINFEPVDLDFYLVNGLNGVTFNDSHIGELYTIGLIPLETGYDYETVLTATAVPISSAVWLLGPGLIGLVVLRAQQKLFSFSI